jgi:chromosome segregation ATPase
MTRPERDDAREIRDGQPERGWPERGWMDLALAAYVDPLARGRTVLFVGEPQSAAATRLGEVAGRLEVVPTGTRQRPSRSGRGTLRSHAESAEWDLVWITDAAAIVGDAAQLREVAEALSPRGVAVLAVDADADYEELYRGLRAQFEHVRMLGQAPFVGQAVVDFAGAQRDPSLSFDGSIVGEQGMQPARYVGLCGARPVSLDPHAIVQLPADESASAGEARRDLDAARARLEHSERRLEQAQREIARSGQKLDELRHELARVQGGLAATEADLRTAQERERAENEKGVALAARLETAENALRAAEEALADAASNEDAQAELDALERSLRDRAKEILELRGEVERRGTLVRDILEGRQAPAPAPEIPSTPPPAPAAALVASVVAPPPPPVSESEELATLRAALVAAQRRAVDAEADQAAASFARDEAAAHAQRLREERASEVAAHARDAGRARGLLARVAELEEVRALLEARAELLHADLRDANARIRDAQRETELVREQYELAVAQARAIEHARTEDKQRSEAGVGPTIAEAVATALSEATARSEAALARVGAEVQAVEAARQRADEEIVRLRTSLELVEAKAARERSELESRLAGLEATLTSERSALEDRVEAITRERGAKIDELSGEISGLRLLVADLEAARSASEAARSQLEGVEAARAQASSVAATEELASLRDRHERVSEAHRAALELQQMTAARADAEAARAIELAQRVLALDGLVARLQSALAQESQRADAARRGLRAVEQKLAEAVEARDALETVHLVRSEEERRTTSGLESRLAAAERELSRGREIVALLGAALADTRALLSDAAARLPGSVAAEPRGAPTDAVLRERLDEMRLAIEDRDILLRSLTAQLQDKDDRIRGLESTLRTGPAARGDEDALRAAVAERDERITRLRGELDEARATQQRLEVASGSTREREAELRRLQGAIADRDAQLMAIEGRAVAAERDLRDMRETFAQARVQLEHVLGDTRVRAGTAGELGDHVAELLRLLRRF